MLAWRANQDEKRVRKAIRQAEMAPFEEPPSLADLELDESTEKEDTLSLARGLLATDKPAPTDEEVAQWLEEHRLAKHA